MEGNNENLADKQSGSTVPGDLQREGLEELRSQSSLYSAEVVLRSTDHVALDNDDPQGQPLKRAHGATQNDKTSIGLNIQKDDGDNLVQTVVGVEAEVLPEMRRDKENHHSPAVENGKSRPANAVVQENTQGTTPSNAYSFKMKSRSGVQPFNMSPLSTKSGRGSDKNRIPNQDHKRALVNPEKTRFTTAKTLEDTGWETVGKGGVSYVVGPVFNAEKLTTFEENMRFRYRNGVSENYCGPLYVSEDIHIACQACGGPLDPITRVPAGSFFFHPHCVRCFLCKRTGITEPFQAVHGEPVCSACISKGFGPSVLKEKGRRGGASTGRQRDRRAQSSRVADRNLSCHSARRPTAAGSFQIGEDGLPALNRAMLQGATAPSLSIVPLHNRRNTSRRSFALMQRQQYYTQSDLNLMAAKELMNMPTERLGRRSFRGSVTKGGPSLLQTDKKAATGTENEFPRLT